MFEQKAKVNIIVVVDLPQVQRKSSYTYIDVYGTSSFFFFLWIITQNKHQLQGHKCSVVAAEGLWYMPFTPWYP